MSWTRGLLRAALVIQQTGRVWCVSATGKITPMTWAEYEAAPVGDPRTAYVAESAARALKIQTRVRAN